MNKCCIECKYYEGNLQCELNYFSFRSDGENWETDKDYCSRWEKRNNENYKIKPFGGGHYSLSDLFDKTIEIIAYINKRDK